MEEMASGAIASVANFDFILSHRGELYDLNVNSADLYFLNLLIRDLCPNSIRGSFKMLHRYGSEM
jgi:hypothetical protein